jgi:hypothetical protein
MSKSAIFMEKTMKFWIWATIVSVLAFGVSITDLKGLLG